MYLKIKKPVFGMFLVSLIGFFVSILSFYILPYHFYNDTEIIIYDRSNEIGLVGSYPFTIWFYKITGLKKLHFIFIGLIQYIIAIFLLYKVGVPKFFNVLKIKNLVVYCAILMIGIFLSMPSKEFINYIYIYVIVRLFQQEERGLKTTIFLVLMLLFFFGYFFRPYYVLIGIISIVLFFVSKVNFNNKKVATMFFGILVAIIMSLSYGVIKGEFISQTTREDLNELRVNGEHAANSAIVSPIDTSTWYGESFGILYGFFSVNTPINGLKHFLSPQIIVFVIWQLFLFSILFVRYGRCLRKGAYRKHELWAFYVLFSFFIVQGIFEPDLGSAVRHKIGVFPLIYYLMYYEEFREKLP